MRYMIMSGTSDSTKVIEFLKNKSSDNYILATTVTDYGGEIAKNAGASEVISEALNEDTFVEVLNDKNIDVLIDTTHPFAQVATQTAINSAKHANVNYVRYERASTILPETDLIYEVDTFEDGALKAQELLDDGKLMHLAGVMNLQKIVNIIGADDVIVRVLPNNFSITKTQDTGIKAQNIIAMQGVFSKEFNKALMSEYNISVMLTKESGESGGAEEKINAALELGIPVILVKRPIINDLKNYPVVRSIEELNNIL